MQKTEKIERPQSPWMKRHLLQRSRKRLARSYASAMKTPDVEWFRPFRQEARDAFFPEKEVTRGRD